MSGSLPWLHRRNGLLYKRPARVLFLSREDRCRGLLAQAWAKTLGGHWLEARSAGLHPAAEADPRLASVLNADGASAEGLHPEALAADMLAWADLLVSLDSEARTHLTTLANGIPLKHWDLPDEDDLETLSRTIRRRVEQMIGGLRMLARMDADDDPQTGI